MNEEIDKDIDFFKENTQINIEQDESFPKGISSDWKYLAFDKENPKENFILVTEKSYTVTYQGKRLNTVERSGCKITLIF